MSEGPGSKRPPAPAWVKVFGVIGLVALVLVSLMLMGVLGKGHGPGRHFGGHRNTGGVGTPAAAGDATRTISLDALDTMTFEPAAIEVSAEETVTFAVRNAGRGVHEF